MAYSPKSLVDVIQHNKSKKLAVSKIIESNPQALPIIPKLVADGKMSFKNTDIDKMQINRGILETIHNQLSTNRQNNSNIVKLFPDIEMSIQILVSSILSPKKMTDIQLLYKFSGKFNLAPTVASSVISLVKEYITETYELEEKLPEIVREALFTSGSYCMAVVPESSVDETVNSDLIASYSTEAFKTKADDLIAKMTDGINIKPRAGVTSSLTKDSSVDEFLKHITSESFVKVTDNTGVFRFSEMKSQIARQLVMRSYKSGVSVAAESMDKVEYLDIFRKRGSSTLTTSNVSTVKTRNEAYRKSIGTPMVVRIPSQSIIPVAVPGNESEHIGYLVLLDENGKPLNAERSFNEADQQKGAGISGNAQTPVQIAYKNLVGDNSSKVNVADLFDMYKDILESQLYSSIQNSLYSKDVKIANKNDIFFLMFSRALAEQKTSILYIPKELLTYFTFYYDEYGVGKSILDNLSILCSLRAILLFARVMAQAKNAIDVTKVNISLSPEDPDPEKTIQTVQDGVLKLRQNFFPLGINNPVDLINWIQRAGLQFAYSNNPLIPDVKIDFESANLTHTVPNDELEESLRKQTFQALGLPPETVDNAFSPEFAVNVVNNNVLMSKRVMIYQKALCKNLSKLVGLFIYNDEALRVKLRVIVSKNAEVIYTGLTEDEKAAYTQNKESFIDRYIDTISEHIAVELPKPENTNMTNLAQEFDVYKLGLESVVESMISSDIFSEDIAGPLNAHIETVRNVFKHHLLRQWCAANNYFPEAMAIGNIDKKDVDVMMTAITGHLTGTMSNSSLLLTMMQKYKDALTKDLSIVDGQAGETSTSEPSSAAQDTGSDEGGGEDATDGLDASLEF